MSRLGKPLSKCWVVISLSCAPYKKTPKITFYIVNCLVILHFPVVLKLMVHVYKNKPFITEYYSSNKNVNLTTSGIWIKVYILEWMYFFLSQQITKEKENAILSIAQALISVTSVSQNDILWLWQTLSVINADFIPCEWTCDSLPSLYLNCWVYGGLDKKYKNTSSLPRKCYFHDLILCFFYPSGQKCTRQGCGDVTCLENSEEVLNICTPTKLNVEAGITIEICFSVILAEMIYKWSLHWTDFLNYVSLFTFSP